MLSFVPRDVLDEILDLSQFLRVFQPTLATCRCIWERSTESSDEYWAMTYILRMIEHRKKYSTVAFSLVSM